MNKYFRTISSCALSAAMLTTLIPMPVFAQDDDNYPTEKTETVYCVLSEDGTPSSTTVSNWIHDEDGIQNIKEILQLNNVVSTKGDIEPSVDGNTYTWNTSQNDVYYQGETNKKIPVNVHVKYYLDNKEIDVKDLEGKNGHLKCVISLNPTITKRVAYGNKEVDIHPAYLCGGALVLNSKSMKNLTVSQGQVVQEGDASIISFVAVPGLKSSLEQMDFDKVIDSYDIQDEIIIEGDVKECEIKTLVMGMTNGFNFDSLNSIDTLSELTSGIYELVNASNQITDGSKQLYDGTTELIEKSKPLTSSYPKIQQLADSTEKLDEGATLVKNGVISYVNGSKTVDAGIQQINEGATQLSGSTQLAQGMKQFSAGLDQFDASIQQAQTMLQNDKRFEDLNQMLTTSKQQLTGMSQVLESSKNSLTELEQAVGAIQQLMSAIQGAVYEIQVANGTIQGDNQTIEQYNAIIEASKSSIEISIGILQNALLDDALSEEDKAVLQGQINDLQVQYNALINVSSLSAADLSNLNTYLAQIQGILSQMDLSTIQSKIEGMEATLQQANAVLDEMTQNVETAKTDLGELNLTSMIDSLRENADLLSSKGQYISQNLDALDQGISSLRIALGKISEGSNVLNSNDQDLINGVIALQNGTEELKNNKDSFNQMADGLQQLSYAFTELNDGAKTLYDGCQKFDVEGMQTLKNKVNLTTQEIDELVDLFNQIIELNNENKDFIGSPENAQVTTRFVLRFE